MIELALQLLSPEFTHDYLLLANAVALNVTPGGGGRQRANCLIKNLFEIATPALDIQ